jgi:hypothetical protein
VTTAADLPGWDETARPVGPGYPDATASQRARGEHLRLIHDMYRRNLAQVGGVFQAVRDGELSIGDARAAVHSLGTSVSLAQLGAFCGQLCRSVEAHHGIEDAALYPALRASDAALTDVLDRLDLEHRVIHDVLGRFDALLVGLARAGEAGMADLEAHFDHLRSLLESHFVYEEQQIGTALGVHGVMV